MSATEHRIHDHVTLDTSHIRNVHYLPTRDLVYRSCGFYGLIEKES